MFQGLSWIIEWFGVRLGSMLASNHFSLLYFELKSLEVFFDL